MTSMSRAEMTRRALAEGVRKTWTATGRGVDWKLADLAVSEVVDALRANPAWCRSLGIGGDDTDAERTE